MELAMVQLSDHPTVQRMRAAPPKDTAGPALPLDADWLRMLCLEAGADDVGFVSVDHPDLAAHRSDVLTLFPAGKALISIVCGMNRENIRTPMRSIANLEFHHTSDEVNDVARQIVRALDTNGIRAINGGAAGFPMEADRWDAGRLWVISHEPIAGGCRPRTDGHPSQCDSSALRQLRLARNGDRRDRDRDLRQAARL
jgi:hypothetical protein